MPQKTIHSDNLQNMIQSHNLQTRCCQDQQGVAEMLCTLREKCFENLKKKNFKKKLFWKDNLQKNYQKRPFAKNDKNKQIQNKKYQED